MSTKGYRQPFRWSLDGEVYSYLDGRKRLEWIAPDLEQAREYCNAATMEWQVRTYGHCDPHVGADMLRAAIDFGFYAPPEGADRDKIDEMAKENGRRGREARAASLAQWRARYGNLPFRRVGIWSDWRD